MLTRACTPACPLSLPTFMLSYKGNNNVGGSVGRGMRRGAWWVWGWVVDGRMGGMIRRRTGGWPDRGTGQTGQVRTPPVSLHASILSCLSFSFSPCLPAASLTCLCVSHPGRRREDGQVEGGRGHGMEEKAACVSCSQPLCLFPSQLPSMCLSVPSFPCYHISLS